MEDEKKEANPSCHKAQDSARYARNPGTLLMDELAFEQFLELIPDAVVVVDESGSILLANGQAEKIFGYPQAELLGQSVEVLIPERAAAAHREHRAHYFADPRTRPMGVGLDLSGRRKDGSEFPADISLSAIHTERGFVVAAAIRDLSQRFEAERERKALEDEARHARKFQTERLESIGELAGGIAHDFNNLMAVILNNAELALEDVESEGELAESLREIYGAAERGAQLTKQLLIFSRREPAAKELVDLNAAVRDLDLLLRRSLGEQIEIEVRLGEALPHILASPSQLEQVILNLAINARDAMREGGRLGIDTAVVELDEEYVRSRPDVKPGRYVRLTVADDGVGMKPEVAERAFEPFFTTKPTGEGTGLGLATVYGIVKQAGGHVAIYSEEGSGTVVRAHFPAVAGHEGSSVESEAVATKELVGEGKTVLVVEDAESVRRTVTRILERSGYSVLETDRGSEALRICEQSGDEIDLVITDLVMPGMLGTELAGHLKETLPNRPVLLMSGYSDLARPLEDDMILIEKPFTSARFLECVSEILGRR